MSQTYNSVADAAKAGGVVAVCLFLIVYVVMMMSADSLTEAVTIFERTILTLVFIFVPTTEVGALVSVFSGGIAAAVSLDDFDPSIARSIFAFGFIYILTNIVINWFMISV